MSSGCVVGTISTTIWLPFCCSKAASLASSAWRCAASSVPVWSITRASSGGTGSTPAPARRRTGTAPATGRPAIPDPPQQPRAFMGRNSLLRRAEVDRGRRGDLRLVLHA
jgi:hypothetical protein